MFESLWNLCSYCPVLACSVRLFSGTWILGPLSLPRRSQQHSVCLCICSFRCRCRKLDSLDLSATIRATQSGTGKERTELRKYIEFLHWNLLYVRVLVKSKVVLFCVGLSRPPVLWQLDTRPLYQRCRKKQASLQLHWKLVLECLRGCIQGKEKVRQS